MSVLSAITNLDVSNAASGTLSNAQGGIGVTTLSANQILIDNASTLILQSANLTWKKQVILYQQLILLVLVVV